MSKYSFEFKRKVVQDYLDGKGGYRYIARLNGIPGCDQVHRWVKAYQVLGDKGLKPCVKNEIYSLDFKLHVVELYLTTEISYQELALSLGIKNPNMLTQWVKHFKTAVPIPIKTHKKGWKQPLKASKKANMNTKSLKELEEENLKLRIENAYLKELRRMRLEEEALLKERRELSTSSEENLD